MASDAHARNPDKAWHIWIDTGGTFTDCLAIPPAEGDPAVQPGGVRRAKVLSSSALRGRAASRVDARRLRISENWGACDNLVAGCRFRLLDAAAEGIRVASYCAAESVLEFESDAPMDIPRNAPFEIVSEEPAPILAARLVTRTAAGHLLPPIHMRLATTRGTNALLERRGAKIALFITRGFGDLLTIGDQQRPDLFALNIVKPSPLNSVVVEVEERLAADGSELAPVCLKPLIADAKRVLAADIRVAAVALMNSHVNAAHETLVAEALKDIGFEHVSVSSRLAPLIRLLPRAQTAVVNAYLAPAIDLHMADIMSRLRSASEGQGTASRLHAMTSAGGLAAADKYRACDSLLSGPAGGVAGAAAAAQRSGFKNIIGFDMGGTSTDVARYDGDFEYRFEHEVANVRMMTPALAIETVAAGGGSICDVVDDRITVGPHSAGAAPGPACYGAGGPLTLTDVNLLLGRLQVDQFEIPITIAPAHDRAASLHARMTAMNSSTPISVEQMLHGFLDVANARMAAAIEHISIRRGYDPADYALVAFGGAGGQHACAVADRLNINTVIMPAEASLLSALGLGQAAIERFAHRQILQTMDDCGAELPLWIDELSRAAINDVATEGMSPTDIAVRRVIVSMRLLGQDASLAVDVSKDELNRLRQDSGALTARLTQLFAERYRAMYGHDPGRAGIRPIEVESIRAVASWKRDSPISGGESPATLRAPHSHHAEVRAVVDGHWQDVPAINRIDLEVGARIDGPALMLDRRSTCVIDGGWTAELDSAGALIAHRSRPHSSDALARPDLVQQELFAYRISGIADEMGQMLQRTALSVNVKERMDFSCALLDKRGELVVNAPHIPVHLGAMGMCVRAVAKAVQMQPGDVVITNHPAFGGSHLPDVTVITPVFDEDGCELIGYVANRAHHAEIGGTRPGSMPPSARSLAEEGVVIHPQHLVRNGEPRFDVIETLLRSGPHPSRAVDDNLADIRAAVAANQRGVGALQALVRQHGVSMVRNHMDAMTQRAERLTRLALAALPQGCCRAVELLDDGSPIHVAIDVQGESATIDFTGSAPVHAGNLNATSAVVRSAVIYVLRSLIGERLPLNEGIMRAVKVTIPQGLLNPPFSDLPQDCPAVVGGNTETSQRVVDALLKALTLCACSQGTMNNVLFGNDHMGYYETVCGGCGAGPGFHGADAVHSHMTNTKITDPEIIEHRYPVRVDRFAIRHGSGGNGRWRGGNGVVRELTFLTPMSLSILSQHRVQLPYGIHGGLPGKSGRQQVIRADGSVLELRSIDGSDMAEGDRFILETPGGGGWGTPSV